LSCTDCLNPIFIGTTSQAYQLKVTSIEGCEITQTIQLITQKQIPVFIPNAFSPNNDGENDRLIVFGNTNRITQVNRFQIFNRYGSLVFEATNFSPNDESMAWDGKVKGVGVANGVYLYFLELELNSGEVELVAGDITLLR